MAEECVPDVQLLRSQKESGSLSSALSCKHGNSCCLLSHHGYQQVEAYRIPSEKVIDLQDGVIQRGAWSSTGSDQAAEGWGPAGSFRLVRDLPVNTASSGRTKSAQSADDFEYFNFRYIYTTKKRNTRVRDKQLLSPQDSDLQQWWVMMQSEHLYTSHEVGRLALDINSVKPEKFEDDHQLHVERAVAMLRCGCTWQRATATHLHVLCQGGTGSCPQILVTKCVSHGKILKDSSPLWNFPRQIWYLCAKGQVDMRWRNRNRKLEHICSRYIQNSW